MATVRFTVTTPAQPAAVLAALTDFSERRPEVYRNIDHGHFRVHGRGPNWAEVTEGNVLAWERNRYDWDATAGLVRVRTIESDSWAPGSSWEYRVQPTSGGSRVSVTVVRIPRTLRGRIIGLGLPLAGTRVLRADLESVLAKITPGG